MRIVLFDNDGNVIGHYSVQQVNRQWSEDGETVSLEGVRIQAPAMTSLPSQPPLQHIGFHKSYTAPALAAPLKHGSDPRLPRPKPRRVGSPVIDLTETPEPA